MRARYPNGRPPCRFDGCDQLSVKSCKGWCSKHFARWRRHGDPTIVKSSAAPLRDPSSTITERTVKLPNGCWIWQGARLPSGYGVFGQQAAGSRYVHRAMWILKNGQIPEGRHVHHICSNKACCNPDHLEILTPLEHVHVHRASRAAA